MKLKSKFRELSIELMSPSVVRYIKRHPLWTSHKNDTKVYYSGLIGHCIHFGNEVRYMGWKMISLTSRPNYLYFSSTARHNEILYAWQPCMNPSQEGDYVFLAHTVTFNLMRELVRDALCRRCLENRIPTLNNTTLAMTFGNTLLHGIMNPTEIITDLERQQHYPFDDRSEHESEKEDNVIWLN